MKRTASDRRRQPVNPQPPSRDSDASFASSRPSIVGVGRPVGSASDQYTDRAQQASAIRSINSFLSSQSFHISLRSNPVSSGSDIEATLKFLLSCLDYPCTKLDEDCGFLLKALNCPFKVNKSLFRALNTPHNWPTVLGVIHWMVELALYGDYLSTSSDFLEKNGSILYTLESFRYYVQGMDDKIEELDMEFDQKLEKEKDNTKEIVENLEKRVSEAEAKLKELKTGSTPMEVLEEEKTLLEGDAKKFHAMINEFEDRISGMEKIIQEKENALSTKMAEWDMICVENKELKRRVEMQTVNSRDVERMKRELQAVERDIEEADKSRDAWEQKSWDLDTNIRNQFSQLQKLAMDCNQALRRLKFDIQYELNEKGSTAAEVMGLDNKHVVKQALASRGELIKKNSEDQSKELMNLQHQLTEMATKIELKKNGLANLHSDIDQLEEMLNLLKKEISDYQHSCGTEAKMMMESVEDEARTLDSVEKEAAKVLKDSQERLEIASRESKEETQKAAYQLYMLIDSISKQKEYMTSTISEMQTVLAETAAAVSDMYKRSLP